MSSINSIGSTAADLLAAIRQQLLAKTSTSSDAQKTSTSNGGLDAIINEIESGTGGSNQTTGTSGSGLSSGVLSVLIVLQGDLLRKHDVAPGKISLRPKAPSGHLRAALIELIDVHHPVGANAIAFAGA